MLASLAAATMTPAQAVAQARSEAAANGITDYVSVTDMATGTVLAQTSNAGTQVASESIVKLMIAAYYMVIAGGYQNQSSTVRDQLSYMIRYSDDATASAYFTSAAVPTIAARYGMSSTINATDRVGHWGAVRITAHDMTTFLFRAMRDPAVGPWLKPVMAQVAPNGSDGFNQHFGMNALTGTHGSKQGWGDDQFWSAANNVINSVGYTDRYYVAVLQNSYSYPDPARATSTYAARTIQAARPAAPKPPAVSPPRNGDYVREAGSAAVYRLAGGAPIYVSSWTAFGGKKPVKVLTVAQWKTLRAVPVDGTFLSGAVGGAVYRVAGGAPIYISSWAQFGSRQATTAVDAAVFSHAGLAGAWSHLRARPADGTFISASRPAWCIGSPAVRRSTCPLERIRLVRAPTVAVAPDALSHAGLRGPWAHLAKLPADGTFITATTDHSTVYRIAGRSPTVHHQLGPAWWRAPECVGRPSGASATPACPASGVICGPIRRTAPSSPVSRAAGRTGCTAAMPPSCRHGPPTVARNLPSPSPRPPSTRPGAPGTTRICAGSAVGIAGGGGSAAGVRLSSVVWPPPAPSAAAGQSGYR